MAQDIVGSLFGVSANDLQAQRQAAAQAQAMRYAQMNPAEQVNYGGYMAGNQVGNALMGMMGAKDPELEKAKMMQELSSSFDLTSEEGLISAARALSAKGMPREAMALAQKAQEVKLKNAQIAKEGALEKRYTALAEAPPKSAKGTTLTKEERMAQFIADVRERQANGEEVSQKEIEIANNYAQLLSSQQYFQGKDGELLSAPKRSIAGVTAGVAPTASGVSSSGQPANPGLTVMQTPASVKAAEKQVRGEQAANLTFEQDVKNIDRAIGLIDKYGSFAAGWGGVTAGLPGVPARQLKNALSSVDAAKLIGTVEALKGAGPTGATGFGSLTEKEGQYLMNRIRSLDQLDEPKAIKEALTEIKDYWTRMHSFKAGGSPSPNPQTPKTPSGKIITDALIQRVIEHNKGKATREQAIQLLKSRGYTQQ